ncbi:AAA family ATPase [Fulvitalea axinellae]
MITVQEEDLQRKLDLLRYKKQIVLQGPPGTGKTFTAKRMAKAMVGATLTKERIRREVTEGLTFFSEGGTTEYTVDSVKNESVLLRSPSASNTNMASFNKIIERYDQYRKGPGPKAKNGNDSYEIAVAKYLFEQVPFEQCGEYKIIQFHPSYSYEDFVRGISAKSDENGQVVYEAEDKVLAEFAQKALKNLEDSKKPAEKISEELDFEEALEGFKEEISERIDTDGKYNINGTVAYVVDIEEKRFRYSGDRWQNLSNGNPIIHNIFIRDFKIAFEHKIDSPKSFKAIAAQFGMKSNASYLVKLLKQFNEFKEKHKAQRQRPVSVKEQNYVLIIDEINRANLPTVLGELIYGLEYRGKAVESLYALEGDREIVIPENLYIIGTMNTADRSVGHMDYAIRRRFAFEEVLPNEAVITDGKAKKLFEEVSSLFVKVDKKGKRKGSEFLAPDFDYRDVQLGHSYFMLKEGEGDRELKMKLEYEIKPILREYVKDGLLLENAKDKIEALSLEA